MKLFLHSLARVRAIVLAVAYLLWQLQLVLTLVARSLETSGQFAQLEALLPPFVRTLLGPAMTAFASFAGILSLGYFEPAVLFAITGLAIALGTRLAAEVESGFIDLVLARPTTRRAMVTRSMAVCVLSLAFVVAAMLAGTWLALSTLAPPNAQLPEPRMIARLAANLGLLGLCWSAIALAAASISRRRGVAAGVTVILALVTFLLDYIARLWEPAQPFARLSPFHYFQPTDLVAGNPLPGLHLIVLLSVSLIAYAMAYVLFKRRDIAR